MVIDKKKHWSDVYSETSHFKVSWYQKIPRTSLEYILSTGLSKDSSIIDVGGGTSVLVDHLIKEKFNNLSILDISENALKISQTRLEAKNKNINWFVSDITEFNTPNKFCLWHDRAVFHFLTQPSDRKNYIANLKKNLTTRGHLIIATFALRGPEKCSGLEIVQYDSEKMKDELGDEFFLVKTKTEFHITPKKKKQKFIYLHFKRVK